MKEVKGWHTYRGTTILQHDDISEKLTLLFSEVKPSRVLEIGTSYGGLTILIRDLLDSLDLKDTDFRTYDVVETSRHYLLEDIANGKKIDFRIENIFNHMYDQLIDENEIPNYIKQEGPTIIFCDGGSKKNEFNILCPHLKIGDIIMAHDYSPNSEYFETYIKDNIWNWHEIQDSDIEESVKKYNLKPYMQEEFQKVVWVCKIKK